MSTLSKRNYKKWNQEDMDEAITKLSEGTIRFNEANRKFHIPKPTLGRHFKGMNKFTKFGRPNFMSENMENEFVEHILNLEKSFFRLIAIDLRKLAN